MVCAKIHLQDALLPILLTQAPAGGSVAIGKYPRNQAPESLAENGKRNNQLDPYLSSVVVFACCCSLSAVLSRSGIWGFLSPAVISLCLSFSSIDSCSVCGWQGFCTGGQAFLLLPLPPFSSVPLLSLASPFFPHGGLVLLFFLFSFPCYPCYPWFILFSCDEDRG